MINWLGTKPKYPAGHCQFCGYNLHSIEGELRPECGQSRFAWVEAECEKCRRVAVYAREEAGRVHNCPFCNATVDVPEAKKSSLGANDSIVRTRLSVSSFIFVFCLAGFFSAGAFVFLFAFVFWLIGVQGQAFVWTLLPSIASGVIVEVLVGIRSSYR